MKMVRLTTFCAALALCAVAPVFADHHESKGADAEMSPEQMQAWMEKFATPGPEHEWFEFFVGEWTYDSRMWMAPGAEPLESSGRARFALELGGRYMRGHYDGAFMGQPFQGQDMSGFDRVSGEYFNLWFDTMGTGYILSRGERSADGKTVITRGTGPDPITGGTANHRMVQTITGENTFSFEMFQGAEGDEAKVMQIDYTRAAKEAAAAK